jgi:hypothetical protein
MRRLLAAALVAMPVLVAVNPSPASATRTSPDGYFVVGDLSATVGSHVDFWGAQWWKDNAISGGDAPAAFKGYAAHVNDLDCPTQWTSDPGNSVPPPPTVGSDITVLVTSHVTKSGPVISGDIVKLLNVHTDPGYEATPATPAPAPSRAW